MIDRAVSDSLLHYLTIWSSFALSDYLIIFWIPWFVVTIWVYNYASLIFSYASLIFNYASLIFNYASLIFNYVSLIFRIFCFYDLLCPTGNCLYHIIEGLLHLVLLLDLLFSFWLFKVNTKVIYIESVLFYSCCFCIVKSLPCFWEVSSSFWKLEQMFGLFV